LTPFAFTHLNRFCAYKMMEARQVYVGDQRLAFNLAERRNSRGSLIAAYVGKALHDCVLNFVGRHIGDCEPDELEDGERADRTAPPADAGEAS
jgi:hypothetical protein